ncbi:hypothetical protein C8Q77DRAFT_697325 [Trametes polyzona]|nr:hypothetical protein C8Q77DRAFT_697325 [Trametes polyzona]
MVSPAPLAAANSPPLSYAERAKKAQNARSPPQVAQQRAVSQGTPSSAANSTSTAPTFASSRPAGLVSSSISSKASPPSHLAGDAQPSSASQPHSAATSKVATPSTGDQPAASRSNGDVNHAGDSAPSAQKQTSAPPVNVWAVRKEQMAARGLSQSRSTNSVSAMPSHYPAPALATSQSAPDAVPLAASASAASTSAPAKTSSATPSINGQLAAASDYDDPFIVKPGRSPPTLTPPAIDDAESWPQVGQAVATPPQASNGRTEAKAKESDEERGHEREASQGHGSRKSEKTKWVPIPPEELQFERPNRSQPQRHRPSQGERNPRQSGGPSGAPSSSSGPGSQQQSRTHSSAGMRPPPSHAGSVSHSQAQSRTGSVHSSPRHTSIRGGGRRLPEDSSAPGVGGSRSIRSSGPNSPATYAQPQPLPPQEFIPGRPFVNTNVGQPARDASLLSTIPDSGTGDMPPPGAYYPPGPPLGVSPYHSPHPSGSPAPHPYALPPMPYPGQPGIPAPVPVPGYGTPPYPVYSYPYGYGQPYMYWPPPNAPLPQGIPATSPMSHAVQPGDQGVPPPTMMARPPPPNESEAVAGYRDVGFALPPPTEHSSSQQGEGETVERGRRRELSFGTITLEGTHSPSPAPGSPTSGATPAAEGAALEHSGETRVSASQQAGAVISEEGKAACEKANGKVFTVFSIGVAPGEAGPGRLRSRTRTQSRGPVAAVTAQGNAQASEDAQSGSTADAVAVLADVAEKVIDLTDSKSQFEFGSTKQVEEEGAAEVDNAATAVTDGVQGVALPPPPHPVPGAPFVPMVSPYAAPYAPPLIIPPGPVNDMPTAPSPSAYAPRHPTSATDSDDWAVRDFGHGFGRGGPPSSYPPPPRDDRQFRDRREYQPQGDRENYGRPRRGSYGQGGFDRGSYGGRRGRGLSGGYGGRGYSNRSFSGGRGGYSNQGQQQRQQGYVPQPPPPPPPQSDVNGYYAPPMAPMATYIPSPYETYPYVPFPPPPPPPQIAGLQGSAPLPVPQSQPLFPLDSTRYYLLGQLEYYLSAQNLERDFFLRQQMDNRGWIPIPIIASFNRVRKLTTDTQLVTDVLTLSSLVEVRDGHVRVHQWQQYILPTAHPSVVEPEEGVQLVQVAAQPTAPEDAGQHQAAEGDGEHQAVHQNHDGDEDEEEDVEFVL